MHDDGMTENLVPDPTGRVLVPGSTRPPIAGEHAAPAADLQIDITVVVRRRAPLPDPLPGPLTPAELAREYGATPEDMTVLTATIEAAGATVVASDPGSRRVRVRGSVTDLEALFGTSLRLARVRDPASGDLRTVRTRQGELSVPAALGEIVTAVLGLDTRPQGRMRFRIAPAAAVSVSYTPVQLAEIYRFPSGTDGSGQTVAIIELGGGFAQPDLDDYFAGLGLATPSVQAVGVDGAQNEPGQDPNGADGEVLLDIDVVGGMAPKADIVVYFGPNTDAGFLDAVSTAAHATPTPAAISISWGQDEDEWTEQARTAMDAAFADAAVLGVVVTAAAGDDGSTDRTTDGKDHCDFPASSPHALGCGGTSLHADASTAAITSEVVWNNGTGKGATGGGVSDAFALPDYQSAVGVPASTAGGSGRGVPDVAAVADPRTGYQVRVDGIAQVYGGTSAVAPLWAALTARLVQALGRPIGPLQTRLYPAASKGTVPAGLRDITEGNNGGYRAGPGWDACTGLGVPDGEALLSTLKSATSAG